MPRLSHASPAPRSRRNDRMLGTPSSAPSQESLQELTSERRRAAALPRLQTCPQKARGIRGRRTGAAGQAATLGPCCEAQLPVDRRPRSRSTALGVDLLSTSGSRSQVVQVTSAWCGPAAPPRAERTVRSSRESVAGTARPHMVSWPGSSVIPNVYPWLWAA